MRGIGAASLTGRAVVACVTLLISLVLLTPDALFAPKAWAACTCGSGVVPCGVVCCDSSHYCQAGNICTNGGCLNKESARVCSNGSYCNAGSVCTPDNRCISQTSERYCGGRSFCPAGSACISGGKCLPVTSERYCGNGKYCNEGSACIGDGKCLPMTSERYCGNRKYCNEGSACIGDGRCLAVTSERYCGNHKYCEEGSYCVNGGCRSHAADAEAEAARRRAAEQAEQQRRAAELAEQQRREAEQRAENERRRQQGTGSGTGTTVTPRYAPPIANTAEFDCTPCIAFGGVIQDGGQSEGNDGYCRLRWSNTCGHPVDFAANVPSQSAASGYFNDFATLPAHVSNHKGEQFPCAWYRDGGTPQIRSAKPEPTWRGEIVGCRGGTVLRRENQNGNADP